MLQSRASLRALVTFASLLLVTLAGCAGHSDSDQLMLARRRLRPIGCDGKTTAVCAVAGVNDDPHDVYLGDWIIVSVCNLDQLVKTASAAQAPITLFIEGKDTGNTPVGIDVQSGSLIFTLDRNANNRDLWRPYLYDPLFDHEVTIRVSVGVRGETALPRTPGSNLALRLQKIYVDWTTWAWTGFLVLVGIALILLALRTDMLREGPAADGVRKPYNLGRVQMAWWFFIVVVSYAFIWVVTSDQDTIAPSVLGLMGISAATALAAETVPSKRSGSPDRATRGWWLDLVTNDEGSVALDRLQIVVWTIVLGFVFLTSVLWDLTMPEFNATMLALMGISSGTYIGFQLPTKSS